MTNDTIRLGADFASRYLVLPFEDGPDTSGLLLGRWSPTGGAYSLQPHVITGGMVYHVRAGRPGALRLADLHCPDPAALDIPALLRQALATPRVRGRRMPFFLPDTPLRGEIFLDLAWGHGLEPDVLGPAPLQDRMHAGFLAPTPREADAAEVEALAILDARVRKAAASHFIDRLDRRSRETLDYMGRRLPYFRWEAFRALADDTDGAMLAFAEAYPLLAGRALSSRHVRAFAASGDMAATYEAALRPGLVGTWVASAVSAHPHLAKAVDGRRRGRAVDHAVQRLAGVPRDHVPRDPAGFAACVDATRWIKAAEGFYRALEPATTVKRAIKGHWDKVVSGCEAASLHDGQALRHRTVHDHMQQMTDSFRHDLVLQAVMLAGGETGPRDLYPDLHEWRTGHGCETMALAGMGAPDRVRHAVRYAKAKPAIVALAREYRTHWDLLLPLAGVEDAVTVSGSLEAVPLVIGSPSAILDWRMKENPPPTLGSLYLPATTPEGCIALYFRHRWKRNERGDYSETHEMVADILAQRCGLPDRNGLGDALLARYGQLDAAKAAALATVDVRRARLAAMQAAWTHALPRRFRNLAPDAFAQALVAEFRERLPTLRHRSVRPPPKDYTRGTARGGKDPESARPAATVEPVEHRTSEAAIPAA